MIAAPPEAATTAAPAAFGGGALAEDAAFLAWLKDDHFTFTGMRAYRVETGGLAVEPGSGLGILRDAEAALDLPPLREVPGVDAGKSQIVSTIRRHAPLDVIAIRETAHRLVAVTGLFTGRAYGRAARDIPLLRRKVTEIAARAGFDPDSHNGKLLVDILDTYPRDELFRIGHDELSSAALQLVALEKRPRFGMFMRRDAGSRLISLMIYVPRRRFDYQLRQRLEAVALGIAPGLVRLAVHESPVNGGDQLVRLHMLIGAEDDTLANFEASVLEQRLNGEISDWGEKLAQHLQHLFPDDAARSLRYLHAFPPAYRQSTTPLEALEDVNAIEALRARTEDSPVLRIAPSLSGAASTLTLYRRGLPIALSDLLPILERFGVRVLTESAYPVAMPDEDGVALQSLEVELANAGALDDHGALLTEAFDAVWLGQAESDDLNRLTLLAGLGSRRVTILRGYAKYLRQARFRFTQEAIEAAFVAYPHIAGLTVSLFETLHDPVDRAQAEETAATLARTFMAALEKVANADDDAIFRTFLLLVRATKRTNYFQRDAAGLPKPALAFKIDSQMIAALLPPPAPLVEIFVYSARMEAVHLRGGRIARGGIRWSDRREDFRTEILGLMKAQMVKNTVIVPVGSKGGFVCKRPPAEGGRAAMQVEAIACYRLMMGGLLDVTDNLAYDGTVIPPKGVVRLDRDDPYLVVAADKGTATFSDIANGIARDYGFWLDDAFASGGSSGYDHKGMGITARGAWESVKRHFREMGRDVQAQATTVAGVGDMSGDVFGNGLLQSKACKLLAAFDHRHIFLDPSPDMAESFGERQRLFDLPGSSWDDYDRTKLSPGGMIVPRTVKSVELSLEVRAVLGIEAERVSPAELMRFILKAPVDLMFFGGIGTYVKGDGETNADAGDRANDASRIDGDELRAKVVAEGANLALTQKGRIAYAAAGGRINTDFIDNSAGVDTSDHEVNIKILLKPLMDSGRLSFLARDKLLAEMTDEVARLVLRDNYQQTLALSRLEARAVTSFDGDVRYMRALEKQGLLNRAVENLPDDEQLAVRAAGGHGLTRPELAVLLAYGKLTAYERLIHSTLVPAGFEAELEHYFPAPLRRPYAREIQGHALKREIVMTRLVNEMVNRAGPTFLYEMEVRTGADIDAVVVAFLRAADAFSLRDAWREIEALDGQVSAAEQTRMMLVAESLLGRVVPRLLRPGLPGEADAQPDGAALDRDAVAALTSAVDDAPADKAVPPLQRRLALFSRLTPALDLVPLARATGADLAALARLHVEVSQRFGLGWLAYSAAIGTFPTDWERRAADALIDETYDRAAELVKRIAAGGTSKGAVERFAQAHVRDVARLETALTEAMALPTISLSLLTLISSEIRRLVLAARG